MTISKKISEIQQKESMSSRNKTRKSHIDDWIIAIPSYKRAETLRDKSLSVLHHYRIPASKIYIFVATEEEKNIYKSILVPETYHKLIIGLPGLAKVRNFISDYFPVGKKIVNMDDDISRFIKYDENAKRNEIHLKSLLAVIRRGFSECARHGCRLWGIYPVANGFFMKNTVSTDLKYIIGCFWGCINPGSNEINITLDDKEDYLRSILFYKADQCVIRLNFVAPKTNYYKEPGGMQEERTMERIEQSARYIADKYPECASYYDKKKSGYPELKLRSC